VVSSNGTWVQAVAEGWLIVQLGGSGFELGVASALQFAPILAFGPLGGVLVDRHSRIRLILVTQCLLGALALTTAALVWTGHVRIWVVWLAALVFGLVSVVDAPARQAFAAELVGAERVANAVALNNAVGVSSRAFGPALAGLVIAGANIALCFVINALSYVAVVVALLRIDRGSLFTEHRVPPRRGQVREGITHVRDHPVLRTVLITVTVVGVFGLNFQLLLTVLVAETLERGPGLYGSLMSVFGLGMIVGSLASASWHRPTVFGVGTASVALGLAHVIVGLAQEVPVVAFGVVLMGCAAGVFLSSAAGVLQMHAGAGMRGRVMALYLAAFLGTALAGGPLVGWLAETAGTRTAYLGGAAAALVAAVPGLLRRTAVTAREDAVRTDMARAADTST
jgi:MFS family permease